MLPLREHTSLRPYKYIITVPTEELRFIKYVSVFPVFFNVTFIYFSISAEDKTVTFDLILKRGKLIKCRYEVD